MRREAINKVFCNREEKSLKWKIEQVFYTYFVKKNYYLVCAQALLGVERHKLNVLETVPRKFNNAIIYSVQPLEKCLYLPTFSYFWISIWQLSFSENRAMAVSNCSIIDKKITKLCPNFLNLERYVSNQQVDWANLYMYRSGARKTKGFILTCNT